MLQESPDGENGERVDTGRIAQEIQDGEVGPKAAAKLVSRSGDRWSSFYTAQEYAGLQQALDDNSDATSLEVTVLGTCNGSIGIASDNVTIQGGSADAGIVGDGTDGAAVSITGRNVTLGSLTISGGGAGADVSGEQGADAQLENDTVEDCDKGVVSGAGASIGIDGGTITGCQQFGVDALGGGGEAFDLGNRFVGALAGLFDGVRGLADLAANLLDRG